MAKHLSRDQILSVQDLVVEEVDVPEWGGSVFIRTMTGTERNTFEIEVVPGVTDGSNRMDVLNMREKLLVRVIVDENGEHVFSDEDIKALGQKSAAALDRLFEVAQRLNRLSAQDVAELEKNSVSAQNGDSGSD